MEPLIEVPELAKLRIRAREAEAEEQINVVRRACEADVATANRNFGGYIDLHRDQIRDAVEQARNAIEAAEIIAAGYVFAAHAIEYRSVLRDIEKLKVELAALRECLIKQYGEHTRAAVQDREARQMELASTNWKPEPEVADECEVPVLVGDASFWRARRNDFREYNSGEAASLSAGWDSMMADWSLSGSVEAQSVFKSLATIAGRGFQSYDRSKPWWSWLNEVRRRRRNYTETVISAGFSQNTMENPSESGFEPPIVKGELRTESLDPNELSEVLGPEAARLGTRTFARVRFEGVHGKIERLFETSANVCLDFEAESAWPPGPLPPPRDKQPSVRRTSSQSKTGKRRGRRPNQERQDAIRNAINKHGGQWRDHLNEILTELDSHEVPLGDFQSFVIDLGDGQSTKVSNWEDLDLAQGKQRGQIVDALRKYTG